MDTYYYSILIRMRTNSNDKHLDHLHTFGIARLADPKPGKSNAPTTAEFAAISIREFNRACCHRLLLH